MKRTKATGPTNAHGAARHTAQPTSIAANPTYMGFRLKRKTPLVTSAEALSRSTGLMAVLLRQNALAPWTPTKAPRAIEIPPTANRTLLPISRAGVNQAINAIAAPIRTTTSGGGILFSSEGLRSCVDAFGAFMDRLQMNKMFRTENT